MCVFLFYLENVKKNFHVYCTHEIILRDIQRLERVQVESRTKVSAQDVTKLCYKDKLNLTRAYQETLQTKIRAILTSDIIGVSRRGM